MIRYSSGRAAVATARYRVRLEQVPGLSAAERERLAPAVAKHAFRATDYYLQLIDWGDAHDPIRRIIVPDPGELADWGRMDPSAESQVTVARGVQHKYPHTVLLLCNQTCGGNCRYCFRKRIFMGSDDVAPDVKEGIEYVARHPEVTNVLLSGGDPLQLPTSTLSRIVGELAAIPHVGIIRIGTRMPAFDPGRILGDRALLQMLRTFSRPRRRIYVITHFDHPRELTAPAEAAVAALLEAGVVCANQCPVVRGVNDRPAVLARLFRELSFIGCPPYYVFQCRPTVGNRPYALPIVESFRAFDEARTQVSGLAKRARYVLSHASGKVEVLGVDAERIYMRYHRARDPRLDGRFLVFARDDEAFWLDDLHPAPRALRGRRRPRALADAADATARVD